jgi:hypothetical protein
MKTTIMETTDLKKLTYEELLAARDSHKILIEKLQAAFDSNPCQKTAIPLSNAKNQGLQKIDYEISSRPEYKVQQERDLLHAFNRIVYLRNTAVLADSPVLHKIGEGFTAYMLEEEQKRYDSTTAKINNI